MAAIAAAFGTHVNDPICLSNEIKIVFDENDGVARFYETARDAGAPAYALIIGGPDGIDPELRAKASLVLAFGAMTWPHQLVRIMATEQIYRAITILSGHPYHRV